MKKTILIASGKGGVGKSTIASNLAVTLASRGCSVGLLDADVHGPSIPTMFHANERPKVRDHRIQPIDRYGVRLLSVGMLAPEGKAFAWHGQLLRGAIKQFLEDTDWGALQVMIVDLPPGTGEIPLNLLDLVDPCGVVVITTPQQVAKSAVWRSLTLYRELGIKLLAIIENMSQYVCPYCGADVEVFSGDAGSALAEEFDPLLFARLPFCPEIAHAADEGRPAAFDTTICNPAYMESIDRLSDTVLYALE